MDKKVMVLLFAICFGSGSLLFGVRPELRRTQSAEDLRGYAYEWNGKLFALPAAEAVEAPAQIRSTRRLLDLVRDENYTEVNTYFYNLAKEELPENVDRARIKAVASENVLHKAVAMGQHDMVKFLLNLMPARSRFHHAFIHRNRDGKTAMDIAKSTGNREIQTLLNNQPRMSRTDDEKTKSRGIPSGEAPF
jgi:hypothetical protein